MAPSRHTRSYARLTLALAASLALWGCSDQPAAQQAAVTAAAPAAAADAASTTGNASGSAAVDAQRLLNADAERGQWLTYGRTYDEKRFSPLDQINKANVKNLGLAWSRGKRQVCVNRWPLVTGR